ncbi:MAG: prepilin-type N-terminal cleavage/methylation domain-containing protein, partial [Deltaproteobacteria bacterium]|nr:prepilin-type N-terminal cleavage/methylation domain-containing protein [Deltaproteobacteria bacterium]
MTKQILKRLNKQGFTLVELLVAMAISGVVMAGIYSVYYSQQKSYVAQEQMAAMQQNLRAAMYVMEREIRMAGCDPTRKANAGITAANATSVSFTEDIRGDAEGSDPDGVTDDPNEAIAYSLDDNDGDGDNDLERNSNLIAENIDALNFVYLDEDGNPTATLSEITSIQVTIVARADRADPGYTDTNAYYNQADLEILSAQNDGFRRKRLTTEVKCRNL